MKIKFNTNLVVNIIISSIIIFESLTFFHLWGIFYSRTNIQHINNSWENDLKPIEPLPNQNLPYYQYIKQKDSIEAAYNLRDGKMPLLENSSFFNIGLAYNLVCDTCNIQSYLLHGIKGASKINYITLKGWTLSTHNDLIYIDEGKFYVKNGQGYVRQAQVTKSVIRPDGSVYNKVRLADVPVKFRYNHKDNYLLIPVTNAQANILRVIFTGLVICYFAYILVLFGMFLSFTFDVSKGEIFTVKNIGRLRLIAFSLLVYPMLNYGLNYSCRFVFHEYFIPGVIVKDNLMPNLWINLLLVIIFLLLYKAFRQGKLLKEEQDLTV